jgi:hypothetical protein
MTYVYILFDDCCDNYVQDLGYPQKIFLKEEEAIAAVTNFLPHLFRCAVMDNTGDIFERYDNKLDYNGNAPTFRWVEV